MRLRSGVGMEEQTLQSAKGAAPDGGRLQSLCFRDRTQHILCVTLRSFIPGAQGTRETLCWK